MKTVKFLQACEDSSRFNVDEVNEAFLNAVQHVSPIQEKGETVAVVCVSKFRKDQVVTVPDRLADRLTQLGLGEVTDHAPD